MPSQDADSRWRDTDQFLDTLVPEDDILRGVRARCVAASLPDIAVTTQQGQWLTVLARATGAKTILEIGTLGGYSAICLARGLAGDGRVVTLEIDANHAEVAAANFTDAGVAASVELRVAPAAESLLALAAASARFDLVFIDADKQGYPEYFRLIRPLVRDGGLIVADNVVRGGDVVEPKDENATGVRQYLELASSDAGLLTAVLQTVGAKDHDGFAVSVVTGERQGQAAGTAPGSCS